MSDFQIGEEVIVVCKVTRFRPTGERNLTLEVADGSGLGMTINSQSPAIDRQSTLPDCYPAPETVVDDYVEIDMEPIPGGLKVEHNE